MTSYPGEVPAYPRHIISTIGIAVDDAQRVLVIQRHDNQEWDLPGGILELGETPWDGVVREVREETGLTVKPLALTGIYKNMMGQTQNSRTVILAFRCVVTGGLECTSDETLQVRWVPADACGELLNQARLARVHDAVRGGNTAVRSHDGVQLLGSLP
jgi:8-oxo-dGTP diphosphatase